MSISSDENNDFNYDQYEYNALKITNILMILIF